MFCHKCGASIPDSSNFCHKCGTKVLNFDPDSNQTTSESTQSENNSKSKSEHDGNISTRSSGSESPIKAKMMRHKQQIQAINMDYISSHIIKNNLI